MKRKDLDENYLPKYPSEGDLDKLICPLISAINCFGMNNYGDCTVHATASCQGHLDDDHKHFPWVGIWPPLDVEIVKDYKTIEKKCKEESVEIIVWEKENPGKIWQPEFKDYLLYFDHPVRRRYHRQMLESALIMSCLINIIGEHNRSSSVKWKVDSTWIRPKSEAKTEEELGYYQENSKKLAEIIKSKIMNKEL